MSYTLIYCAEIHDEKHQGMLKVGETTFEATQDLDTYIPNHPILQKAALERIKGWGGTAAAGAKLVYCESLIRYNVKTKNKESFGDKVVHRVLNNAGFPKVTFDELTDTGKEWFKVDLETVKVAIKAAKEYRDFLDTSELPEKEIYPLREEQLEAINSTKPRFQSNTRRKHKMLWHAKMRFGKTITALNLVKELGYKKTIIITHRPVVEDSWGSDFYHVFTKEDKYVFATKITQTDVIYDDNTTEEIIDKANDERLKSFIDNGTNFVYFASIQDLVGSKIVGGNFEKNKTVFEIDWDLVIVDEAHEGIKTEKGNEVLSKIIKSRTKKLDLSGTAYNLMDEYAEAGSVYVWDYIKEQTMKKQWPFMHPGEPNPYEDMPTMNFQFLNLKDALGDYNLDGKFFTLAEFLRTWTGDFDKDKAEIPNGIEIGDFVHEEMVEAFLDSLSDNNSNNQFPYSTEKLCQQNAHSLWIVPGVKEAKALSKLLRKHHFFGQKNNKGENIFGIANVAGKGDDFEEKQYKDALQLVRKTIGKYDYSITLSCGRLTTGVTVKEWTAVLMLSGTDQTDAKHYMQTVFRVQSAWKNGNFRKTDAYVYDFAPDRVLNVIYETVSHTTPPPPPNEIYKPIEKFLELAPVLSLDGGRVESFDAEKLIAQINRVQNERIALSGFTDRALYNFEEITNISENDLKEFNEIFKRIGESKISKGLTKAGGSNNGVTGGKGTGSRGSGGTGSGENTEASTSEDNSENESNNEKKARKSFSDAAYARLNNIAVRIPLLFYAGDFDVDTIKMEELVDAINNPSWKVFMPKNFTKKDFVKLSKFFNRDRFNGAGKKYREDLKLAEELTPTGRVNAISNIFDHFKNPAKETVLTPWRVVNMHLASTLGGHCFYNEQFKDNDDLYFNRLLESRKVIVDEVSDKTLLNPNAQILEINSKTGLYPLYVAYSIYMSKLGDREESSLTKEELYKLWDEAACQVYVLCQTELAAKITERTLFGFRTGVKHNIKYDENLLKDLKNSPEKVAEKIKKGKYWGKECSEMKFDAVVGNPPYQEDVAKKQSETNGQAPLINVFHFFQQTADKIVDGYVSLIYPGGRWIHRSGKGLDDFGLEQINDVKLVRIDYYPNSKELFNSVEIADGITIVLKSTNKKTSYFEYRYCVNGQSISNIIRSPGTKLIQLNPNDSSVVEKVRYFSSNNNFLNLNSRVLSRSFFSIESDFVEKNPNLVVEYNDKNKVNWNNFVKLFTNDKAGKSGRSKWYLIKKNYIPTQQESINKWKVIVSSANAGGQKRDWQIDVFDNHTAFGRSRVGLGIFNTKTEAENFYKYCKTYLIRFLFLMTDESLTTLAKEVPDFGDYSNNNKYLDFSKDLDIQLFKLFELTKDEIKYIKEKIDLIDKNRGK